MYEQQENGMKVLMSQPLVCRLWESSLLHFVYLLSHNKRAYKDSFACVKQ